MIQKRIIPLLLILGMLFSLAACSDGTGASLYFPISAAPSCLDPQFSSGKTADLIINNVFEGLLRYDASGALSPGVAESWEKSADGLTYTFHLRKDARWQLMRKVNGKVLGEDFGEKCEAFDTALTAKDFVFAFRRACDPATQCPDAGDFAVIQNAENIMSSTAPLDSLGVTATDAYTLVITLNAPCVDFPDRLTHRAFMPCNETYFTHCGGRYGINYTYLLGNGPFYIAAEEENTTLTLKRSEEYSGQSAVCPAAVTLCINTDTADIADKLGMGTYCGAIFNNPADAPAENVHSTPVQDGVYGFCFNCADEVMQNEYIRLALCSCIRRMDYPLPDSMTAYCKSIVPKCCVAGDKNYAEVAYSQLNGVAFNTQQAQLYWNTGLKQSEKEQLNLTLHCTKEFAEIMRTQLQLWQQTFGVSFGITLQCLEPTELERLVQRGEYQLAFAPVHADSLLASDYLKSFCTDAKSNIFHFSNGEYDAVIKTVLAASDEQDLLNGCYSADCCLAEHGAYYPMYCCAGTFAVSTAVTDLTCSPGGDNLCFIWAKSED